MKIFQFDPLGLDINQNSDDSEESETDICDTLPNNSLLRNGLGSTGFTWPGGIIPYEVSQTETGWEEEFNRGGSQLRIIPCEITFIVSS